MSKTATATKEKDTKETPEATPQTGSKKQVQSVEYAEAVDATSPGEPGKLDIILDMQVPATVNLGRTEIPVRRLLQLGPGSVIPLDKPVDAPVELYLKEAKFADGDVVVLDGRFAIRIKRIVGVEETAEQQQE